MCDLDDISDSLALDVMGLLHQKRAIVSYADPDVPALPARSWPGGRDLASVALDRTTLADVDCVAVLTDHRAVDYGALVQWAPLVVDTRNAVKSTASHVFKLGAPRPAEAADSSVDSTGKAA